MDGDKSQQVDVGEKESAVPGTPPVGPDTDSEQVASQEVHTEVTVKHQEGGTGPEDQLSQGSDDFEVVNEQDLVDSEIFTSRDHTDQIKQGDQQNPVAEKNAEHHEETAGKKRRQMPEGLRKLGLYFKSAQAVLVIIRLVRLILLLFAKSNCHIQQYYGAMLYFRFALWPCSLACYATNHSAAPASTSFTCTRHILISISR